MTAGTIETKGTRLYFAKSDSEILKVACPTGITGLGGPADQIETTCLDSIEKEYVRGMLNPGKISVPINLIPRSASHQALLDLKDSGDIVSFMIVLSDQTGEPTISSSDGRLESPGATTFEFLAYVDDVNVDITTNEIVKGTVTLQRSGAVVRDMPTADLA